MSLQRYPHPRIWRLSIPALTCQGPERVRTSPLAGSPTNGRNRRVSPVALRPGEGRFTQLTAAAQAWRRVGCNTVYDTAGNVWNSAGTVTAAPQDVIIDARNGSIDAHVYGAGAGDEVWFNEGDGNYYATGSGSPFRPIVVVGTPPIPQTAQGSTPLGVVDAKDQKILQLVTTFNVPAVGTGNSATQHPASTAHSVAANAANNHIFVPLGANNAFSSFAVPGASPPAPNCETGCIAVFGHSDED